ncbi:hypothetical protein Y032_0541g3180 [Ancylostoma ceylanicum]|uniref:Uncharacterized protein n=1 Tax=Ancylostoma ceylanicum TaxID=53326 RepID=A0A016WS88_9BILA|nr:hypothetical protein Y032_0541g3180 [Ancylostoma ceylanicum]
MVDVKDNRVDHKFTVTSPGSGTLNDAFISLDHGVVGEGEGQNFGTVLSNLDANSLCYGDLPSSLQRMMRRVRKIGCIVDAVQVKPTRRKLKCWVDACVCRGPNFESIGFRCTLPSRIESAVQWICICVVRRISTCYAKFYI